MDSVPPRSGVQTVDRAVGLLDAVARAAPCTLNDLVRETGLARPTAHRLAVALEDHGLVVRDGDGRFRLGARLVGWGAAAGAALALVEPARGILQRLSAETGESAQLYVREGDGRRCLLSRESTHELRTIVPEGARLPLDRGSAGRILGGGAAGDGEGAGGWVESVEERAPGVASVSAPVHDATGAVVAAVGISGPVERLGPAPGARFGPAVTAAAHRIEQAL